MDRNGKAATLFFSMAARWGSDGGMGGSGFLRPDFVGCAFQNCRPLCFLGGFLGGYLSGVAHLVTLTQSRPLFLRHFMAALFLDGPL